MEPEVPERFEEQRADSLSGARNPREERILTQSEKDQN